MCERWHAQTDAQADAQADKAYVHDPMLSKTPSRSHVMFFLSSHSLPFLSAQDPVRSRNLSASSEKVHPPKVHGRLPSH